MDNSDKVHVAIIRADLSDEYNRHTGATMVSVMETCSKPVVFHILHEEKNSFTNRSKAEENIKLYQTLVKQYNCEVQFHNITLPEWINGDVIHELKYRLPVGFYRFYLPEVVTDAKYVVSLGSDVIVNTDLSRLISTIPDGFSLAASKPPEKCVEYIVNNVSHKHMKYIVEYLHCDYSGYVNADVQIFNLEIIRKTRTLPDGALTYLKNHPIAYELEQGIFNAIFSGDIFYLNPRYNVTVGFIDKYVDYIGKNEKNEFILDDTKLHFANRPKPWDAYLSEIDLEYWKALSKTPWANDNVILTRYFVDALKSPQNPISDVLDNIDERLSTCSKQKTLGYLFKLTFPLYLKLIKRDVKRLYYRFKNWR